MRYFDDFKPGDVHEYGHYDVTAEEIIDFARQFDPQPFHLDEAAASASLLGGLATSGWHTAAISMRLHCQHLLKDTLTIGSPGVPEMKWIKPVLKGFEVHLRTEIAAARESQSRPGMGIIQLNTTMLNQHGTVLMTSKGVTLMATRAAPAHLRLYDPQQIALRPEWPEPADILSDPAAAADTEGLLTGWLDDIVIGRTIDLGTYRFESTDITRFASKWDPQLFHVDPEAARNSVYGGQTASGWHTAAVGMGRHVRTRQAYLDEGRRRGHPDTPRGPSPGFRDMQWHEPVFAGDTIHYYQTHAEKRAISRPGWGILTNHYEGINQHGRKVYEYMSSGLWPFRKTD
ncbi:MAG: MaoC family dehydratase N-terminal domain-containing protein [Hyphomicrobiales bacterium]|nr:MaoC family dehydratase N-terminal domain-containing protein [Hyphomicrobiales bacterium]